MSITSSSQVYKSKNKQQSIKNVMKFFEYIHTTVFPNIVIHDGDSDIDVEIQTEQLFTPYCIHEYIWGYKYMNHYYSLLKLKDSKYVYIKGYVDFDSDEFKIYSGTSLTRIISYMSESIYRKYEKDTSTFQTHY